MALVNIIMKGGRGGVNKLLTRGRGVLRHRFYVNVIYTWPPSV